MRSDTEARPDRKAEETQQFEPVEPPSPQGGPIDIPPLPVPADVPADSTEVDGPREDEQAYPDTDPDTGAAGTTEGEAPERSRAKTFGEAMADAHQTLIRMTGNMSAAWDELTEGFSRTVSIRLPLADEGSDGRAWSGQVWRVFIDSENRIGAAWDGYSDVEGFGAALFAANRKRLELIAARKEATSEPLIQLS